MGAWRKVSGDGLPMDVIKAKAVCKKCGGDLGFIRRDGKFWPVNPDGSDHFDVCRERRYAKAKRGQRIETDKLETWRNKGAKDFDIRRSGGWIRGKDYLPVDCDCGVPPWEVCKHSFSKRGWHETSDSR